MRRRLARRVGFVWQILFFPAAGLLQIEVANSALEAAFGSGLVALHGVKSGSERPDGGRVA